MHADFYDFEIEFVYFESRYHPSDNPITHFKHRFTEIQQHRNKKILFTDKFSLLGPRPP